MANVSITGGYGQVKVLLCPQCKETINTSVQQCPYCSATIDAAQAEVAAAFLAKVNQACSDGSYIRIMAGTMMAFFGLRFLPVVSTVGFWGSLFLLFALPVMTIRWWVRFGGIKTDDPDFRAAKRSTLAALGIWAVFACLMLLLLLL